MALTIAFDGTGIVGYSNAAPDTGGGAWGELGAGTVGDNPDVYLYGSNSFGSKYASKDGWNPSNWWFPRWGLISLEK